MITTMTMNIPGRMKNLDVDRRGIPIPKFVYVDSDGKPEFRIADQGYRYTCAKHKVCWICGSNMGKWSYFIGGPLSSRNHASSDGWMHKECARYALQVCPYLAFANSDRTAATLGEGESQVMEKPDTFHLMKTRNAKLIPVPGSSLGFLWSWDTQTEEVYAYGETGALEKVHEVPVKKGLADSSYTGILPT